jgi:7-cyano-7-deazaguanine synthase
MTILKDLYYIKMNTKNKKYAVLSLSGGMDSSTLLLHLLAEGYEVQCLSFDYGQKHIVELERAQTLVRYINTSLYRVGEDYMKVKHQIITLDGLSQLLDSSLVTGGNEVPEGHYAHENMKDTVVPNRNMIFSSIVQAVALSIANKYDSNCIIALGLHSGDHAIYPDTTEEFRQSCLNTFRIGNWNGDKVDYYTPYMETDKSGILRDGEKCCAILELDFNEVYRNTNTSYKPIYIDYPRDSTMEDMRNGPKGDWYSDYKSASSVERIEAFMNIGRRDPLKYADETGPVIWEFVKQKTVETLKKHLEGQD